MPNQSPISNLQSLISADELMRNTTEIAQWIRLSAQPAEWEAAAYVEKTLASYGVQTHVHEADILVSFPRSASVSLIAPETATFEAYTHSFATSTPTGGLSGELVHVGAGFPADLEGKDVRGKIVLVDGLAAPPVAWAAEQAGAAGIVFISGERLHFMIVSTVWGTPTPETAWRLPKIPSASVTSANGAKLKALLAQGKVQVRLDTETWTGWSTARMVEGRLDGQSDEFVLLSGHLDSWEYGAMDNGSANATMMETMRVLAQHKGELKRGVRCLFWSGHSHGRYAGSTWYVDHHWQELYDHCVAHVNVDSTGARGATAYDIVHAMSDLGDLATDVVQAMSGQMPKIGRMGRNSDQSFWGLGIPAMYGALSRVPPQQATKDEGGLASLGIGGMPWWWHTVEDTVDKIDPDILVMDTAIVAETVRRLCSEPILPLNYTSMTDELIELVAGLQSQAGAAFDLGSLMEELQMLRAMTGKLNDLAGQVTGQPAGAVNRCLVKLGRLLIPLNYTESGLYDQDLAVGTPPLPSLQAVAQLAKLDPHSDDFRFLYTRLVRARNRAVHTIKQANEVIAALGA